MPHQGGNLSGRSESIPQLWQRGEVVGAAKGRARSPPTTGLDPNNVRPRVSHGVLQPRDTVAGRVPDMTCSSCGQDNPEGMKFCGECGSALSPECSQCGFRNPPTFKFCGECGAALVGMTAKASPAPDPPAPRSYTPKHLAQKILNVRSALEGERKQVTVLFADVKGSMELSERLDDEAWHGILDRFFEILNEGVHRFEGTVNQYTGDGIMALFGAPLAHEDHPQRACYAALDLSDRLSQYADDLRRTRGLNFSTRIGINSGEVVVGKIGDDLRMDYTALGHTVGLAQRMEQLCEPGRVYLTDDTARAARGFFELRDMGVFSVKGSAAPVRIHRLEGVSGARTRLDVARERGLTRFVGRSDEMGVLEAALARVRSGHGQVVGVVGEAGVGKSRLCFEFVESCRSRDIPVYEAHCPAHGKNVPFLPILELFRNYFGIGDNTAAVEARQKIAGATVLLDPSLQDTLPVVFEFLGVGDPDQPAGRDGWRDPPTPALCRDAPADTRAVRARPHHGDLG